MKKNDHLSVMLDEFKKIKTWTKNKKTLKSKIITEILKLKLQIITTSKSEFHLTKFGQTKILKKSESIKNINSHTKSKKIQLICLGQEHCVYYRIAIRDS
jgi:hypothetical protein